MAYLNDATDIYIKGAAATAAYLGGVKVWPPGTNSLTASLVNTAGASGSAWVQVRAQYSGTTPAYFKFYSNTGPGWVHRYTGGAGPHNFDTTFNTNITMKVESYTQSGLLLGSTTTNTVNSGSRPTQQRAWSSVANQAASYNGSNNKRTDQAGIDYCFYGYYSSTHGIQKSLVTYPIPAEIRHCVSVDRVQVHWYNQHHFQNAGGQVSLVAHHGSALPTKFPGSTGPLLLPSGEQVKWPAPKTGEINGTSWFDVGFLHSAGRPTINEEIRVNGMQGLGLVAAVGGQAGYGYARTNTQLHITYTVFV